MEVEKRFDFDDYSVVLTPTSIVYYNVKHNFHIPLVGNFKIKWRANYPEMASELEIENVYMKFICWMPHEKKAMFDFIARGFKIYDKIHENPQK